MDVPASSLSRDAAFLQGGGGLGRMIRDHDWSTTPVGPIKTWSGTLKTTVALILRSPVPMVTLWGDTGVMIYNDAYAEFAGKRHPKLLGMDVLEGWPEAAEWNAKVMQTVFHGRRSLSTRDLELTLHRNGAGEPVWMNLDYSPVVDEDGTVAGVIAIVVETTAKVRAERQLVGDRERLRQMFDQAPGFIALLEGSTHVFTMANRAYFNLVGGRELIGLSVVEALPEVAEQGFIQLLDKVYQSREAHFGSATPILLERGDGTNEERFVDFVYQPLFTQNGELSGIFVQGHDVTDQQQAIRALQESEKRFRLVAERAPVMLWMGDPQGRCLYLNKAQREFWGVSEEDYASFDWATTVHPDDQPKLYAPFQAAMQTHQPFTVEARYRRADGAYRRIETHAQPRIDTQGHFLGMIGVNTDVTDAREAEERYRRIFEQASDLILTADLDQTITDCNPAAAAAVGLSRDAAIGRRVSDFISPDDYARTKDMLGAKLERGGTTQYEVRVRSSTGEWLFWEVNSGLTFDDAGSPVGLHVVGRDVTERKRFERHQQLLVGELNHRVKNTLAIVQSLAHRSFSAGLPSDEAIKRFEGRLEALAGAHNLLTRHNWDAASIGEVVHIALAPFCSDDRCHVEGPDLRLPPHTAVSLALALHELSTNAAKYGALSNDTGRISVKWSVGDELDFRWSERGGPSVSIPEHRGFGTRMIERTLAAEFGGSVSLTFDPEGVSCRFIAPVPQAD